jgi:pyruvate,water dikinase
VREAELRELSWGEDPGELAMQLWTTATAPRREAPPPPRKWRETIERLCAHHPGLSRRTVRWLAGAARQAVKDREYSKSIMIRIGNRLRGAYRRLGALLAAEDRLPDADLLFFLTHEELGQVVQGQAPRALLTRALHRRRLLPEQMELRFPDFCRGLPAPLAPPPASAEPDQVLCGLPVSPGRVRGPIRVIRDKRDARRLRPGEIICARFTDVGWTPYYSTAGGVITEIGSALSHGAVVAREYRLPLVTSIEGATTLFRTGELVELDGTAGRVSRIAAAR